MNRNDPDYAARTGKGDDSISLLDLLGVLARRKWLIIGMTAIVAVIALVVLEMTAVLPATSRFNFLPNKYKPTAEVLIQSGSSSSTISSLLNQSGLSSLSGLLGTASLTGGNSSAQLALALLKGRTIEDGVVDKFDFVSRYKITKYPRTSARLKYENSLKTKFDDKTSILEIGYEDIDPQFATDVVNEVTDRLQDQFTTLTMDKVQEKRLYLEKAIATQQVSADIAAAALSNFQTKYGVYDLPTQTEANITALATLNSQLKSRQMDLDLQQKYTPETDTRIVMLKDQISQLERQIQDLRTGVGSMSTGSPSLSSMMGLSARFATVKTDVQVQQAILLALKQQLETTKLEEQDTSPTFQIVEKAEVPEVRSAPSRSKTAIIITLAGFFVSVLIAFVLEYFDRARREPIEAEKLLDIGRNLAIRKKSTRD